MTRWPLSAAPDPTGDIGFRGMAQAGAGGTAAGARLQAYEICRPLVEGATRARDRRPVRDLRARRARCRSIPSSTGWTTATSPATRSGTATPPRARRSATTTSDRPAGGSSETRRPWTGSTTRPTTSCSRPTRSSTSRIRLRALAEWKRVVGAEGHLILVVPHLENTFDHRAPGDDPRAHRGGLRSLDRRGRHDARPGVHRAVRPARASRTDCPARPSSSGRATRRRIAPSTTTSSTRSSSCGCSTAPAASSSGSRPRCPFTSSPSLEANGPEPDNEPLPRPSTAAWRRRERLPPRPLSASSPGPARRRPRASRRPPRVEYRCDDLGRIVARSPGGRASGPASSRRASSSQSPGREERCTRTVEHLGDRARGAREDRRSGGQRLGQHQAELLLPGRDRQAGENDTRRAARTRTASRRTGRAGSRPGRASPRSSA